MADEEKNVDPRVAEARRKAEAARNRQESPEEREKRLAELKKQAQAKKAQMAQAKGTDGGGAGQAAGAAAAPADTGTPGAPGWRVAEGGQQVQATRVEPRPAARPGDDGGEMSRRNFLRVGFWSGMGLAAASGAVGFLRFFWPTQITGFGSVIRVPANRVPAPGDEPVQVSEGKLWLVNLQPGEGGAGDLAKASEQGGLLALYWKCPHLGCTVPWRGGFNFEGQVGWFRCPCHGSTYNRAGVRVFGPAPRPMDTMAITVNEDGSLDIDTGNITPGSEDNPQRAQPL